MKRYDVVLSHTAEQDLDDLAEHLSQAVGAMTALRYVDRLRRFCERLAYVPHRGTLKDDGTRIVGFERRVSVRFRVATDRVEVVSLRYAGRRS